MSDPQQQFLLIPSAKARGFTRGARHPLAAGALCIALAVGVGHGLLWNLRRSPAPRPPARSGMAPVAPRDTLDTLPPVESGQVRPGAADSSSLASRRIASPTSRYAAPTPVPVAPPPARRPAPKLDAGRRCGSDGGAGSSDGRTRGSGGCTRGSGARSELASRPEFNHDAGFHDAGFALGRAGTPRRGGGAATAAARGFDAGQSVGASHGFDAGLRVDAGAEAQPIPALSPLGRGARRPLLLPEQLPDDAPTS